MAVRKYDKASNEYRIRHFNLIHPTTVTSRPNLLVTSSNSSCIVISSSIHS